MALSLRFSSRALSDAPGHSQTGTCTEFAAFSIAVFHCVRGSRSGWQLDWVLYTLLIAVSYAGLDEWHQSFVSMREASVRDEAIDATGAVLAQVLVCLYAKRHRNSAA